MTKITNPLAPINAPEVPSAGDIASPFARENLSPSQHPALQNGSTGGQVAGLDRLIADDARRNQRS